MNGKMLETLRFRDPNPVPNPDEVDGNPNVPKDEPNPHDHYRTKFIRVRLK
jgi:hypothetical protein